MILSPKPVREMFAEMLQTGLSGLNEGNQAALKERSWKLEYISEYDL